ncbi:TetR/AcrR family transcriptional regulator [Bacillus sp. 03113]|uniref:TetR/AcrR family transcriptional regulator n=1 Tax=Bacillus sp. 03113 TaxID=2578211 RepID=UPI001144F7BA|nr:TetR/AcrR family transcriptional regulator [Bacillus sp. 03113]
MKINQIKQAALLHFVEKGYEGTSLSDIAEEVGIKKQSIYSHFKNKDDLFLAIMNQVIEKETQFLNQFFTHSHPDLQEHLKIMVLYLKERFLRNEEGNMKFVLRMAFMPPLHLKEEVVTSFNLYFLGLENMVKQSFLNTTKFSHKASEGTLAFMTLLDGLFVALLYGGIERFEQKFPVSWEIFWNGLRK